MIRRLEVTTWAAQAKPVYGHVTVYYTIKVLNSLRNLPRVLIKE